MLSALERTTEVTCPSKPVRRPPVQWQHDGPPCIDVGRLPSCESTLSRSGTVYNNRANRVLDGPSCVDLDNLPSSESRLARAGTVYNNRF